MSNIYLFTFFLEPPETAPSGDIMQTLIVGFLLQVIDPINKLIDTVEFDAVFYSLDWHPADHVSFIDNIKQRPIHPTSPVSINVRVRLPPVRFQYHYRLSLDCIINPQLSPSLFVTR